MRRVLLRRNWHNEPKVSFDFKSVRVRILTDKGFVDHLLQNDVLLNNRKSTYE